jgi:hypothetical protein
MVVFPNNACVHEEQLKMTSDSLRVCLFFVVVFVIGVMHEQKWKLA